ncbi:hypothetical protein DFH11DRAFT_1508774 [Phellopilus nigrolimitatus]|nr:hypothetical protein DFH11DRAFT_1508774 [Phellopilus nigrolimitatus]
MSSRPTDNSPWPAQTSLPLPASHAAKRKRSAVERRAPPSRLARATIANESQIDQAKTTCFDTDNSVLSCWPTADTVLDQNEATQFVWNSNQPSFAQFNLVNIGLFRADTGAVVTSVSNYANPSNRAGSLPITAGDEWWGSSGSTWSGQDIPFAFYFVVVQNGTSLSAGLPQATFTAIQTTFANSVIASMSSTSAAAASSSAAAASSSSLASRSSLSPTGTGATDGSGSGSGSSTATSDHGSGLQNSNGASSFPHWAIAVIVILGFFALAALVALIFLLLARARRRRIDSLSRRGSMGSQSPMMANIHTGEPASPQLGPPPGLGVGAGPTFSGAAAGGQAASFVAPDGASTHSDSPFSGADAAVMAEAFRKALRKPDFADRPVLEGESPENLQDQPELLNRELAEEGRDIRSVGSSRGVRVETLSDDGDTATAGDSHG